jgi:uncharacterized membrane protein
VISRFDWIVAQITGRLWFWAVLYGVLAVATALAAIWLSPFIPDQVSAEMGADAVEDILRIIATSMLAVATFSLSTMVSAFDAATNTATPRAAQLLTEDRTAQNAIATFIGAFVYSLVGIIALRAGLYGSSGRLVLFGVTIFVVVTVVITFFRWIDYIARLGRLSEILGKVENAARETVVAQFADPHLGGRPWREPPAGAMAIGCLPVGYIQHVDIATLAEIASRNDGCIHVARRPGAFVSAGEPLCHASWQPDDKDIDAMRSAFLVGSERSFRQDPRFGLIVMAEIASRALSPGINDPGTAIDVLGRVVRVLSDAVYGRDASRPPLHDNLFIAAIDVGEMLDDVFLPVARDGAGMAEVGIRLQKALLNLAQLDDWEVQAAARRLSRISRTRSEAALQLPEETAAIARAAEQVAATARDAL